jgi:nucleotide-binding universal stress UspA family protein
VGPNDRAGKDADERRIVVGVDGSACATRALEFAVRQAALWDAPLHVVSAYHEMPAAGGLVVPGGLIQESAEAIVADATRLAEDLEPTVVVKGETVLDAPGPALARLSKGATALVVGTRGHSEVVGAFLGSVSQYVLHHATCNTIVVR